MTNIRLHQSTNELYQLFVIHTSPIYGHPYLSLGSLLLSSFSIDPNCSLPACMCFVMDFVVYWLVLTLQNGGGVKGSAGALGGEIWGIKLRFFLDLYFLGVRFCPCCVTEEHLLFCVWSLTCDGSEQRNCHWSCMMCFFFFWKELARKLVVLYIFIF